MNACKEINTRTLIDAITEDALMTMDTAGVDDPQEVARNKRCLQLIGRAFNVRPESEAALEKIRKYEDGIRTGNATGSDRTPLSGMDPLALAMDFFNAAIRLDSASERADLFDMMDYIADYLAITQEA